MLRNLAPFSLATGFAIISGCVIVADDTDDSVNDSVNATSGTVNTTGLTATAGDETPAETAGQQETGTPGTDTAVDSSGGTPSLCGWGDVNEKEITEGYICNGEGVDPAGTYPIGCPDVQLVAGAECGEILGQGCCNGDTVWFCQNGEAGQADSLQSIDCV